MTADSPLAIKNVRLFIAFRVFFNARFYYPVFTILFLDFGLSLSQFAILNAVWAATIVLMEVPSGALADIFGRRNLLVLTGVLMIAEMALLCFAPRGNASLLFALFVANRVLSGVAEAAASGADEALAYDAMQARGMSESWGRVLSLQMRLQSAAFVVAMSIGAAVYDPELVNRILEWMRIDAHLTQSQTLRFPLYLTLAMAFLTLVTTIRMEPAGVRPDPDRRSRGAGGSGVADAMRLTMAAGRWIVKTPQAMVLILTGMVFDHVIRMVITLNSQYFRVIELPEAIFGIIGSLMATVGLFMPLVAERMAARLTPVINLMIMALLTLSGLVGMTFVLPYYGVLPILVLVGVMSLNHFFLSHYLNRITDSRHRATVLSFKGLSYNMAYGAIGLMYSGLLAFLRMRIPAANAINAEQQVYVASLDWFPGYFIVCVVVLLAVSGYRLRTGRKDGSGGRISF